MILHKFGFYDDTEIVFYDYSKQALAFKKLLKEWDGEDYPKFLDYAVAKYQINETEEMKTQTMSRKELWDREIEWWGSEKLLKNIGIDIKY